MQVLENSVLGLRSARLAFRHPATGSEVTIFPMVHVGEGAFFERVFRDARGHAAVLLEGVSFAPTRLLTASYRWLDHEKLGLVVQPSFDALASPVRIVHADLDHVEMKRLWKVTPFWLRAMISVGAPLYGLYMRFAGSRESLAKGMGQDVLKTSREILEEGDEFQPLRDMITTARDAKLARTLFNELGAASSERIAVIYGAGHASALVRELTRCGFRPLASEWMTVFTLDW